MGFIIWYKVQIEEGSSNGLGGLAGAAASLVGGGLPVTASNDVFSGQYILDADIRLTMLAGAFSSRFEVRLTNLPRKVTDTLKDKHAAGLRTHDPLQIKIHLGYFEDSPAITSPDPVMIGAVTHLKSQVNDDGIMQTTLKGQELGGYRLHTAVNRQCSQAEEATAASFLEHILAGTGVKVAEGHGLTDTLYNYTFDERHALEALRRLAQRIESPVVIRDNQVYIKDSVGTGPPIVTFSPNANIIQLDEHQDREENPNREHQGPNAEAEATPRTSYTAQVLGNPKLRVGQRVKVELPDEKKILRIQHLIHRFSSSSGYICDPVILLDAEPGEVAEGDSGAHAVASHIRALTEGNQRTSIDIGQVTEYAPGSKEKHLVTLNYGQSPARDSVAPSVDTAINDAAQLYSKPIAAPFAWHNCGLVVPVYNGMRALLAHNLDRPNDAIVTGFLWPENPRHEPPQNEPGDYWLCLPTDVKAGDTRPSGKGTNDLIDGGGRRVIQVKGLHILVGADALPKVGARPEVSDDIDNTIIIEHQSGTKITIASDGAVNIETSNQNISLTNGSVTLGMSGSTVEVS